jgi:hypothetical protein
MALRTTTRVHAAQFSMSDYVEARYVKSVLERARSSEQDEALELVNGLLRDLSSLESLSDTGTQTLTSIRLLALGLVRDRPIHASEWDTVNKTADAWCQSALT